MCRSYNKHGKDCIMCFLMFMVKQHSLYLIYAHLSRIRLSRDYALFGGTFGQHFHGRGHQYILKDREWVGQWQGHLLSCSGQLKKAVRGPISSSCRNWPICPYDRLNFWFLESIPSFVPLNWGILLLSVTITKQRKKRIFYVCCVFLLRGKDGEVKLAPRGREGWAESALTAAAAVVVLKNTPQSTILHKYVQRRRQIPHKDGDWLMSDDDNIWSISTAI